MLSASEKMHVMERSVRIVDTSTTQTVSFKPYEAIMFSRRGGQVRYIKSDYKFDWETGKKSYVTTQLFVSRPLLSEPGKSEVVRLSVMLAFKFKIKKERQQMTYSITAPRNSRMLMTPKIPIARQLMFCFSDVVDAANTAMELVAKLGRGEIPTVADLVPANYMETKCVSYYVTDIVGYSQEQKNHITSLIQGLSIQALKKALVSLPSTTGTITPSNCL